MKNYFKLFTLVAAFSATAFGMETSQEFIKLQDVPQGLKINATQGGMITDNVEYLDLLSEDPLTLTDFKELMKARTAHGLPYIVAVVAYTQPGSSVVHHSYYDATELNKNIFGMVEKKGMKYNYKLDKPYIDPLTRSAIDQITYIGIYPNTSTKVVEKSSDLLNGTQLQKQNFAKHFYLNNILNELVINPDKKVPGVTLNVPQTVEKLKEIYNNISSKH